MSIRFDAINNLKASAQTKVQGSSKITAIFGENVFNTQTARKHLSDEAFKSLQASIKAGQKLDRSLANQIANGIRGWA